MTRCYLLLKASFASSAGLLGELQPEYLASCARFGSYFADHLLVAGFMLRTAKPLQLMSPQAYLEFEEDSAERHEYVDGVIHALPGETLRHNQIAGRLYTALLSRADERGCRIAFEGVKLWIPSLNRYYYPDVMVFCDPRDTDDKIFQYPCFITEVFSPSTEGTDRREKSQAYRTIETLQGYPMLDPKNDTAEYVRRTPQGWRTYRLDNSAIEVDCLGISVDVQPLFTGL